MSRKPDDPAQLMWAKACDLMAQAERMHRQFFRLASSEQAQPRWEPPVDVFEDEREVVIMVAMPGVSGDRVEVSAEPGVLMVRGERPLPLSEMRHAVRQLEIPYGYFERRIRIPHGPYAAVSHEMSMGCLVVRLHKG